MSALNILLLEKGVFTKDEYDKTLTDCADDLNSVLEKYYPGVQTHPDKLKVDIDVANEWLSKFPK